MEERRFKSSQLNGVSRARSRRPYLALRKERLELTLRGLAWSATALYFVTGVVYLILGRWPVTHQDFWLIYDVCLHRSWFSAATLKYNGHSHFFPSQLWLADLRFFHGNQDVLFTIGLGFQLIGSALLLAIVWKDESIGTTVRTIATLIVIFGNFWMARASMTASGGFNCCYSLVLLGLALSFFCLLALDRRTDKALGLLATVIAANVVASFSFGTGMVAWAATLITGYTLRLRLSRLAVVAAAATASAAIFLLLPAREAGAKLTESLPLSPLSTGITLLGYLCRLLGSPLFHVCAGWLLTTAPADKFYEALTTFAGFVGLLLSAGIMINSVFRRNLHGGLEAIGFALMTFGCIAFVLITVARAQHIYLDPRELNAPRYLYWSSLFWSGLFLFALGRADHSPWLRWPSFATALALAVFAFPSHYREGRHWHYTRLLSQQAATSLIDGIHNTADISILSPSPAAVYRLTADLRARRVDMFAKGYQDWLGQRASTLFRVSNRSIALKGECHLRNAGTKPLGLRVSGWIKRKQETPEAMVILDQDDIIRGISFSTATPAWINRFFYRGFFPTHSFVGFIPSYDPRLRYTIRMVDGHTLSRGALEVPVASEREMQPRENP